MTMPVADPHESDGSGIEAREYLRVITRRRWTIANTVLLCAALAVGYVLAAPKSYSAQSTVLVKPVVTDWTATSAPTGKSVDIATEQSVAASDATATDVVSRLHLTSSAPADLLKNLTVTPGTAAATTLTFGYSDRSATTARNLATAFASSYLGRRQAAAQGSLTRSQRALQTQITQLEAQLSALELKRPANSPQSASETIAANQISSLRTTLTRLSLATVDAGSVIAVPPPADKLASSPSSGTLVAAGLLLGLLLGLVLAFFRDRMSNRMFLSPSTSALLRPPVLATIPLRPRAIRRYARAATLVGADAGSPVAAAFGRAAEHVRAQLTGANASVVVTSAREDEAASVVAVNLAAALAGTGTSVTLLTRLDPATVAALDGGGTAVTFADALAGRAALSDIGVTAAACPTLRVVPFGELDPGTLRTNAALDRVRLLQESRHLLVLDAPALLAGADGLALAATADLVLLTVVDRVTRRSELAAAADHITAVGPALLRTILLTATGSTRSTRSSGRPDRAVPRRRPQPAVVTNGHVRTEPAQHPSEVSR